MSDQPKPTAEQAIRYLYAATEAVQMTPEQRREVLAAYDFVMSEMTKTHDPVAAE